MLFAGMMIVCAARWGFILALDCISRAIYHMKETCTKYGPKFAKSSVMAAIKAAFAREHS